VKIGLFCTTPAVALGRAINSEKKLMEMLLTGEPITAQEAHTYGLVNKYRAACCVSCRAVLCVVCVWRACGMRVVSLIADR
jgi:hypothetical protein